MPKASFRTKVRRWGHTPAVRIPRADLRRLGLREGVLVRVTVETESGGVRMDDLVVIHDGPDVARTHDEHLGQALEEDTRRWRRRRA